MSWLSEDPWYVVGALGLIAAACLVALRLTRRGRYLVAAGAALGLAAIVLVVEHAWVTDAERVEAVVAELANAVRRSDADAALALVTPDVSLTQGGATPGGAQVRALLRATLAATRFDFLTVSRLRAEAGRLTRRGRAEFRVDASGTYEPFNFSTGPNGSAWSLGFREEDGRWRVERVAATRLPAGFRIPGFERGP